MKTFPMSCYASSKDREKAIFEYIQQLEQKLAETEKQNEESQEKTDLLESIFYSDVYDNPDERLEEMRYVFLGEYSTPPQEKE